MNITIPFSKEILFKSKIAEITSISLEHDVSINEKELLGDFIVSGEYKNLDVNVDTNPFSHVVPFSVNLDDDIDIESLKYEIEDFSYEIKEEDILKVNILFHVTADKIVFKHEDVFERPSDDVFEVKDERVIEEPITDDKSDDDENTIVEEISENRLEKANGVTNSEIITNNELVEDYITYHIHLVKAGETYKSISKIYNISEEELQDLNDYADVSLGDKLLIPEINEEE